MYVGLTPALVGRGLLVSAYVKARIPFRALIISYICTLQQTSITCNGNRLAQKPIVRSFMSVHKHVLTQYIYDVHVHVHVVVLLAQHDLYVRASSTH